MGPAATPINKMKYAKQPCGGVVFGLCLEVEGPADGVVDPLLSAALCVTENQLGYLDTYLNTQK